MSTDFPAKPRSDAEVRRIADDARAKLGLIDAERVDIISCLQAETVHTVFGPKRLFYRPVPRAEFEAVARENSGIVVREDKVDGLTTYGPRTVTVWTTEEVHRSALMGDPRARFTLAHEFGHATMHEGAPKARGTNPVDLVRHKWMKGYESAEHQAGTFAATFLINDRIARGFASAEEVSVRCGVSLKAAEIYCEGLKTRRDRAASAERIDRLAAGLSAPRASAPNRSAQAKSGPQPHYLSEICTSCGSATMSPAGSRFSCDSCGFVSDRFQDGDTIDG